MFFFIKVGGKDSCHLQSHYINGLYITRELPQETERSSMIPMSLWAVIFMWEYVIHLGGNLSLKWTFLFSIEAGARVGAH